MGMWKFSDSTSLQELVNAAKRLARRDPRYLQLCIRRVAEKQRGVCFIYQISPRAKIKQFQDKYIDDTAAALRKEFGRGLQGWEASSTVYSVK